MSTSHHNPEQPSKHRAGDAAADSPSVEEIVGRLDRLWNEKVAEPSPFASLAGTTVGPYVLERVIGRGAFGIVYKARDQALERDVALKIPRPEVLLDAEKLRRFEAEAKATAHLDHPAVVPLFEAELTGAIPYLASAYCPGPNLQQWLDENPQPRPGPEAARFLNTLAEAVHHAHEHGIVHRDLKPGNILLTPIGDMHSHTESLDDYRPRLTDFGLARLASALDETRSSLMLGTPLYMSPEQAECRHEDVAATADIFSLGAMLYHLLTGVPPFAAPSYPAVLMRLRDGSVSPISEMRPDVDPDLETICLKALQTDCHDRYATARELADDLQRHLAGEPVLARRVNTLQKLHKWTTHPSRVPELMLVVIITACVRICTAVGGLLLLTVLKETPPTDDEIREVVLAHLLVTIPADGWIIWAARQNAQRKLHTGLYWFAFILSAAWALATFLVAIGIVPGPLWYQRMPGARTVSFLVITLLFTVQTVCWYLGDWTRTAVSPLSGRRKLARRSLLLVMMLLPVAVIGFHSVAGPQQAAALAGPATSIALDGVDDYVGIPNVGFAEAAPFTLEAWIQPADERTATAVAYMPISIGTVAALDGCRLRIQVAENAARVFLLDTDGLIPKNQWAHVAVTYDGQQLIVFLNGRQQNFAVSGYDADVDDIVADTTLPSPLILTDVWPGADVFLGIQAVEELRYPFAGRIGEVRLSRSVFYRGSFTPAEDLSVGLDTQFLFHLKDGSLNIQDATSNYDGTVIRENEGWKER